MPHTCVRRAVLARLAVLAGVLCLTATGCSVPFGRSGPEPSPPTAGTSAPASHDPATQPAYAPFYGQRPSWQGCGRSLECTTVTVPVDWSAPSGQTLGLSLVRRRASGSRIGSLLINPGGPGVAGADWLRQAAPVFGSTLRDAFDLVGWDPRGTGASAGIRCLTDAQLDTFYATDATPDDAAERQTFATENAELAAGCKAHAGALFSHVDTLSTVKDMDVLRAVLGDRTLSYFGASYGTFLGAWYAQEFPWRVGRMVLDGAVDPSLDSKEYIAGQAMGFDRAVTAYLSDCLHQAGCPWRGTPQDARDQLGALLQQADSHPLRTSSGRMLTQPLMATGIIWGMYAASIWKSLNEAMTKALQGDGTALLALADSYDERDAKGRYSGTLEAYSPIYCLDHPETRTLDQMAADAAELGRRYPPLGDFIGWGAVGCLNWPAKPVLEPQRLTAPGAAPILVVGTTGDPATPYEWAKSLASQLSSGRLVTREGSGHTAYLDHSSCIDSAVEPYLVAGILPAAGTVCR
ncbi:MAG TPA: alpha/beta hydrolase [Kineosporiaceae bacterium]